MLLRPAHAPRLLRAIAMTLLLAAAGLPAPPSAARADGLPGHASLQAVGPVLPEAIPMAWMHPIEVTAPDGEARRFAEPLSRYRISSPFGRRTHPIRGRRHLHSGVDLAAPRGTSVLAIAAGTVVDIQQRQTGYGCYVVVDHGDGYRSWYAHLQAFAPGLRIGSRLLRHQPIGQVGSSGAATGPHLHLEIRHDEVPQEPLALLHPAPPEAPATIIGIAPAWRANAAPP
ncbi:M23 family metallopeptidase [Stenotrophomonas tumulicola]|uniref:M23 family metallopeptidase n=1 Tax=Stenotrophomonas tumulicola TaxID=1685415 RepID=A0A7W3FQ22_9GAMM|nr:M23 family metallopeptidase [Stenotrophomonas tumulicola]MBA8683608.1 M23 family metallopeptidase [Stenotrophomonas tumulicola]